MQILGQIFFNHQQIEPARIIWQRAIAFSQSSYYTQIEAKSLIGIGNIERYINNLEPANLYHQQAVDLLDKIGAKCDLAEAYLQWGITLQASNKIAESQNCFKDAIELFEQIQAPKQVERVKSLDLLHESKLSVESEVRSRGERPFARTEVRSYKGFVPKGIHSAIRIAYSQKLKSSTEKHIYARGLFIIRHSTSS